MLKKIASICFVLLCLSCGQILAQKTIIKDAKAKNMLLGKHKVSLQWISWNYFGNAEVTQIKGVYYLKGEQNQQNGNDFLKIDGKITSIDKTSFTFEGKIETSVSHIKNGEVCERNGEMIFRITGKRKYWRLMQMENPCDGVTDYVDIYFR